ncbi:porin [Caballeronia sp. 15711]|uniref:porin n=1 Tax=Caballeronia sp. 15711 TaxID=3391029 RepID=UPI0039E4D191
MKKRSLGIIPACLLSGAAMAQGSVTLYGLIDQGIDYTNNAGTGAAWKMQSGDGLSSRWGLKGTEDIGSGLHAIFTLENGFDGSSGLLSQPNRIFGRQAFVGVSSDQIGTLTFGRQYDSVVDFVAPLTANGNWGGYLFSHPLDNDNTDDTFRVSNSVKYLSNSYGGFTFGGVYGFSNQEGAFANNRAYSVGTQYSAGPLTAAAAFMSIDNPGANSGGALPSDDGSFVATRERVWTAGINYTVFEAATLGFVYSHTDLKNPVSSVYVGAFANSPDSMKFDNYEFNAKYQFNQAFYAGAMYTYTHAKVAAAAGDSSPSWHQAGLMVDYNLSKRTDVYAQAVYQKLTGNSTGSVLDTALILGAAAPSSSTNQVVVRVALRHQF